MTKAELLKALESFPDDIPVHVEVWSDDITNYMAPLIEVAMPDSCVDEEGRYLILSGGLDEEFEVVTEEDESECPKPKPNLKIVK